MIRIAIISGLVCALAITSFASADMVTIGAARDNTLYEDAAGALSNGAGMHCFTGITSSGFKRRAVFMFDIAGSVPAGSTIQGATLTLNMSRSTSGAEMQTFHRLLADWGEGASDAGGQEGGGAPTQAGDASWLCAFSDGVGGCTSSWINDGGDFTAVDTDPISVVGVGPYQWGGPQLTGDVQDMFANPAGNFGWILLGEETTPGNTKRYDTRENPTPANRPALVVFFVPPCIGDLNGDMIIDTADLGILLGQFGTTGPGADINGDGVVDTADLGILLGVFGTSCP